MTPINDNQERGDLARLFIDLCQRQARLGEELNAIAGVTAAIAKKITENDLWK